MNPFSQGNYYRDNVPENHYHSNNRQNDYNSFSSYIDGIRKGQLDPVVRQNYQDPNKFYQYNDHQNRYNCTFRQTLPMIPAQAFETMKK